MKKLRLFTAAWGDEHIARMERALVKSLRWPRNYKPMFDRLECWHLWTKADDVDRITSLARKCDLPFKVNVLRDGIPAEALLYAAREIFNECIADRSLFMIAFADIIFGDGSIENMCQLAERDRVCVTVPHMRVLPTVLDDIGEPLSNAALVAKAIKHAHPSWREAEATRATGNSFKGGICWEKIDGLYFVQHRIPNIWVANIEQSDVEWFGLEESIGTYDHNWPGKTLDEERNRMIGSSDAAFIVEVTRLSKGLCPSQENDPKEPDKFYRDRGHHRTYRTMVSVFRPA